MERPFAGRWAVIAAVVALGMSGCGQPSPDAAPDAAEPPSTPSAAAAPGDAAAELPLGSIGAAELTATDGSPAGRVEFGYDGGGTMSIALTGFPATPDAARQLYLAPSALADPACLDVPGSLHLGSPDVPDGAATSWGLAPLRGDPSFLDEAVLTVAAQASATASAPPCVLEVVARGTIAWSYEPLRSGIVAVDSGATGGASGTAEVEGAAPVAYTVAAGDLAAEVAARFGMTEDELHYLNPARVSSLLQPGEVLNLVLERR